MHRFRWFAVLAVTSTLGVAALAGDGKGDVRPQHGGVVSSAAVYRFEVLFERGGLKVYPLTKDGKPLDTSRLAGTATFYHPNSPNPWFSRELGRGPASADTRPTSLDLAIGLGTVPETGAKVAFKITGLPDQAEPAAEFTTPVRFAAPLRPAIPPALAFFVATKADEQAIAAQRVCKVSGEPLGSMGVPVKVTRGASSTFLCCRGCVSKVQADPDRFLGPVK
jgi:hypothetical protein